MSDNRRKSGFWEEVLHDPEVERANENYRRSRDPATSEEERRRLTRDALDSIYERLPGGFEPYPGLNRDAFFLAILALILVGGVVVWLLAPFYRALARALRRGKQQAARGDAHVRRMLRRGRENSPHPPPTGEELEALWEASRPRTALEAKLRLGACIADLEPVVDRRYIRDEDGAIVGRQPGVRGWLEEHAPRLLAHYKTLMAYKLLAEKFTMVCGNWSNADTAQEAMTTDAGKTLLAEKRSMCALGAALDAKLGIQPRRRRRRAA